MAAAASTIFSNPSGRDLFYAVNLLQGEVLEAQLSNAPNRALLYLVKSCLDLDSCLVNATKHRRRHAHLPGAGDDRDGCSWWSASTSNSVVGTFQLDIDVRQDLACAPGQAACASSSTVSVCDVSGQTKNTTTAAHRAAQGHATLALVSPILLPTSAPRRRTLAKVWQSSATSVWG